MNDHLMETPEGKNYPIQLDIDYPDSKLNRWSCFFRLLLAIPILLLFLLMIGNLNTFFDRNIVSDLGFVYIAPLIMIVFFKKYPKWWFDWNLEVCRFLMRINAYFLLLTHEYPLEE